MENPFEEKQVQRPTMLIVLCVLTFIGSGWGLLSNLFSLFKANLVNGNMEIQQYSNVIGDMEDQGIGSFLSDVLSSSVETLQVTIIYAKEIAMCGLVLGVLSLAGAVLMFQMRRLGFYFYTGAQVLMLFVLPYFAGFTTIVMTGMFFSALITAVFVVLYAVNLKYMR